MLKKVFKKTLYKYDTYDYEKCMLKWALKYWSAVWLFVCG